ncbi:MAG: hypothetical protein ACJ8CX_16725 [Microvirga sp.]
MSAVLPASLDLVPRLAPIAFNDARAGWAPARVVWLSFAVWALVAAASLWLDGARALLALPDPDDAMRLVQVRDLLAGQGWFDLVQHRVNPPDGTPMHWSRLVDAPIAAMIVELRPLLGPEAAERWAVLLWPLVPALLLLPSAGLIGNRLAGVPGAVLTILAAGLAVPLVRHFVPGRIDHHNVQMALSMALIAALVFIPRRPAAYAAGAASALSIAVGLETLPYVALGGVAVMAGWWRAPAERSAAVLAYLSAFAVAATLALAATVAPSLWLVPACDMISAVYLLPLWAALGIAAAARLGGLDRGRAGVALIVGTMALAALASVALLNPACLAGPYAEADPRVLSLWMNHLAEVRSALTLFRVEPVAAVSVFAAPLAGLAVAPVLLALPSWRDREAAAIVVGALALATMLALLQVRTLPFAAMFAAAPLAAAAALAIARRWRLRLDPIWGYAAAACLANPFAITLAAAVAAEPVLGSQAQREAHAGERLCTRRAEYRVLATLPPGTVASLISFGSYILAETPHRVVAAPYHRNRDGVLDTIAAFTAKPDESRAILARRGVDTIAFCTTSTELDHLIGPEADTLANRLKRGDPPAWLEPVADPSDAATRVYRLKRG